MSINKTSLIRLKKDGAIHRHSSAVKPFLKKENKLAQLKFYLSMFEITSIPHDPTFKTMHNIVYIDEKWFYISKKSIWYYILPDEKESYHTCKNNNYITKVMFSTAQAHPRFGVQGNEIFYGKMGIFPFVIKEPTKIELQVHYKQNLSL